MIAAPETGNRGSRDASRAVLREARSISCRPSCKSGFDVSEQTQVIQAFSPMLARIRRAHGTAEAHVLAGIEPKSVARNHLPVKIRRPDQPWQGWPVSVFAVSRVAQRGVSRLRQREITTSMPSSPASSSGPPT
jgi:hypothetical protein